MSHMNKIQSSWAPPAISQTLQAQRAAKTSSTNPTATSPLIGKPAAKNTTNNDSLATTLRQAVATALQKVKNNQAADPNDAVESALAKVLKATLSASKKASSALNASDSSESSSESSSSPASSALSALTGSIAGSAATPAAFSQMLQSNGITEEQFQQDLVSALKDASANSGDPSSLSSLPSGLLVDLLG